MKKFSPGAATINDNLYICDNCEKESFPALVWPSLPDRKGHFCLCYPCLRELFIKYISYNVTKSDEKIIIKRMFIPEKMRNEIFERDGSMCVICDAINDLEIDHIIPFSCGGKTERENLRTLCKRCNLKERTNIKCHMQI